MKRLVFLTGCMVLVGGLLLGISVLENTWAYTYDLDEAVLFYEEDEVKLSNKILKYLDNIDEMLIVNSSFELADRLVDNYDFLVHFAVDYVLKYQEYYSDKIVMLDDYSYVNRELIEKKVNLYIPIEVLYEITDKYFGVRDFAIINDDVNIIDGYVSLSDYTERVFSLKIERVEVIATDNVVEARVCYGDDICYLYTFNNVNQILKINNVEIW